MITGIQVLGGGWQARKYALHLSLKVFETASDLRLAACSHQTTCQFSAAKRMITEDDRRRFYILSIGPTSQFIAFCLRSLPDPPPVTFLVWSNRQLEWFQECEGKVTVIENSKRMEVTGIRMEVIPHMDDPVLYPIRPGSKDFAYKSLRLEPDPRIGHRYKF